LSAISAAASALAWVALLLTVLVSKEESGPLVAGVSMLACVVGLATGLLAIARSPRRGLGWVGLLLAVTWLAVSRAPSGG